MPPRNSSQTNARWVTEVERIDYVALLNPATGEPVGLMRLVWGRTIHGSDALDTQYLNPATGEWVQSGEVLAEIYDGGAQQVSTAVATTIAAGLGGALDYPGGHP